MQINPLLQTDFYKQSHYKMYPKGTTKIYSNLTPRKSRIPGINKVVVFGLQSMIVALIIDDWTNNFFDRERGIVIGEYKRIIDNTLGKGAVEIEHIEELHKLGYMPLHIKALPEGTLCPIGVPCLTITNTVDHAYWLVNFLETIISANTWGPMTAATLAFEYKKILNKWANKTCDDTSHVQWQAHDFSMRGLMGMDAILQVGMGHLTSFTGTDNIPAIAAVEKYYNDNTDSTLIGASVPATEHSVQCMHWDREAGNEDQYLEHLLDIYPEGIVSMVSDGYDLFGMINGTVASHKDQIMARNGKLVIRPDSGDPVDIICGKKDEVRLPSGNYEQFYPNTDEGKGVIELLWEIFGGTINEKGYKVLDSHIGCIYGDSITIDRAEEICNRLESKGFASCNIILGVGSFTYQYNTRDTLGFAVKATYGEITSSKMDARGSIECKAIYKDPKTDDGTKRSASGLLYVYKDIKDEQIKLFNDCGSENEKEGLLRTIFLDGKAKNIETFTQIRERLENNLK